MGIFRRSRYSTVTGIQRSPPGVLGHEVDGFGGYCLDGYRQVPFVLTLGIIDDDEEFPLCKILDRLFYGCQSHALSLAYDAGSLLSLVGQEAFDVLGQYVHLQVYPVSLQLFS